MLLPGVIVTSIRDNRELFDITNEIFLKRFFAVFLFWKKNFLAIGGGEADLFGPLWITLSYVAIMGFMGNFTVYLVDAISFKFMENRYANTFGTVAIFTIAEIIFYPSILHCLGGFMLTKDVKMLKFRQFASSDTLWFFTLCLLCCACLHPWPGT